MPAARDTRSIKGFITEVTSATLSPMILSIWALLSFAAALTGPFGTYAALSLQMRVLFWATLVALSIFTGHALRAAVRRTGYHQDDRRVQIVTGLIYTAIFTPIVCLLAQIFAVGRSDGPGVVLMAASVFSFFAAVLVFRWLLGYEMPAQPKPRLLDRFPNHNGSAISRLSVDDHYVDVFFADGARDRLLMRLTDAIAEMDEVPGFPVHRSHWVARDSIAAVEREGGRDFLLLHCGTKVPVSRKKRPILEEAGIFEPD